MMPPVGPQYDRAEIAAKTQDIVQRMQPATTGTWIVGIILVIAALAWMTLLVTRSHHTSVMPLDTVRSAPEAPRSATRVP
jgi:hypothetical protein